MPKINSKNTYYDLTKRFEDAYGNVYDPTNLDLKLWLKANDTVATVGGFPVTRNSAVIELNQHISKKQYPAFRKTGASSSLSIADAKDLNFPSTESFTLSMWIYHPPGWTTSSHGFVAKGSSGLSDHEWEVFFVHSSNNGYIMFRMWDESQNASVYRIATNLNAGQAQDASSPGWKHWVFTDHSTNTGASSLNDAKIYLNGAVLSTSANTTGTFVESEDLDGSLKIGLGLSIASTGAETKFAEIAIWKSELSLTQIKAIYNATKEGVIRGYEQSGFTTQNPRVALEINDNAEDLSYQTRNLALTSRNITGKSFRDSKFDDSRSISHASGERCEVITLSDGLSLLNRVKFYIRGADGIAFKVFAISLGDDARWKRHGGLKDSDIKVDVTPYLNSLNGSQRSDAALVTNMVAQALGEAIEKEKSLKLSVDVKYNQVYLKDHHVESSRVSGFSPVKPPRAIHHPRSKMSVTDGDLACTSAGLSVLSHVTITDGDNVTKKYTLVDGSGTPETGTVLVEGSTYASGQTLPAGHASIGSIAFNVGSKTLNGMLVEIKKAIEGPTGHNGSVIVGDVPAQANGAQSVELMSAVPHKVGNENSRLAIVENLASFSVDSSEFGYIGRAQCTITRHSSNVIGEGSHITIVTADGTSRKYLTMVAASTSLKTGDILKADSDTGSSTAGNSNVGAIGVARSSVASDYFVQLQKAIKHPNGHGDKIKITNPGYVANLQQMTFEDMTSSEYYPRSSIPTPRSSTETGADGNLSLTDWGFTDSYGVSGGKIVESVLGDVEGNIKINVVSTHGILPKSIHGVNVSQDSFSKNMLVGHNKMPDLRSSVKMSQGSQYDTLVPLVSSGSSFPFKEDKLFAAFGGEPGPDTVIAHSYVSRKSEMISSTNLMGEGFESQLSSKECITIELDASQGSNLILYPAGQGVDNEVRPNMAYLNNTAASWSPITGDRAYDKSFPGNSASSISGLTVGIVNNQAQERSTIGFGQGQSNLFRMLKAPNDFYGSFVLNSFKMSAESLESEKERYAFIESSHNPCINSFGFPSHPKFYADDSRTIDMSRYIDEDFLVESVAVQAKIDTPDPRISCEIGNHQSFLDRSAPYATRNPGFAELKPTGCTFFLLNQRKSFLPIGISQNTFHLETDPAGTLNRVSRNIQREGLSIPGWYPAGARQAWSRGTAPSTIIYNGGNSDSVNSATHANSTGWSFKGFASNGSTDADFFIDNQVHDRIRLHHKTYIITSTAEDVTFASTVDPKSETAAPPYMPLPEGYSLTSYLTTSEAYRLRFIGRAYWSGSNTCQTFTYIYVYATYIDKLLEGDATGIRNLVARYKVPRDPYGVFGVFDIPLKTVYDNAGRKFNLSISVQIDGTYDDNYLDLAAMEIYRVEKSNYVDTIRDVIGWGPVGLFPTEFDELVGSNLATKAKDPRDSYSLIISDDTGKPRDLVVTFPAKTPAYGNFGTLYTDETDQGGRADDGAQIISNWDAMGRSGIEGVPSDRSVVRAQSPGVEPMYISRQYNSRFEIPQPKKDNAVSPYLLKKHDKLILGVQSLTDYAITPVSAGNSVTIMPSKVTIKLYGSRVSKGVGTSSQTYDMLGTDAVHEAIGNYPIRDQFETEPAYNYEGSYLDNIIVGDPNLQQKFRGGELIDLGIGTAYDGQVVGLSEGTAHIGKKEVPGFGKYGDFNPFLPTFQSVASPPSTFPAGDKFLIIDQNGLGRVYQSNSGISFNNNPVINGTTTINGVTYTRVLFYNGGSNQFQTGVRQLTAAINDAVAGHSGGFENQDHLYAVESTFDATVTDKRHVIQIIPRVKSREEADLYDDGTISLTFEYHPVSTSYWTTKKDARYQHLGGATLKAAGLPVAGIGWQWNWHRKSKDFNRGVVARSAYGTAGITGSFQKFVQLKEDQVFKYDSLVIPTYEFLSMFDVYVPWNQSGTSNDGSQHSGNAIQALTGAFLPLFQRGQIINQLGGLYTGYSLVGDPGEVHQRIAAGNAANKGWDKNVTNLCMRWPFERGDRRSIDALNPTTFKVDVFASALKKAQDICRVNVPDLGRLDAGRMSSGSNVSNIGAHFSASLVGLGRGNATWVSTAASIDGVSTHLRRTPKMQGETEWASYSPRENPDVAKKTLKALFGFETSHFMRWGTKDKYMHMLHNGNDYFYFRTRYRPSYAWGMAFVDRSEIADSVSRSHIVVRGMRYGIENYVPTEDKVYMRYNRYGQFRDMLEQRKFYASCGPDGVAFEDRPVQIQFVSRQTFDDTGNVIQERRFNVAPETTNSQNLSTYATASIPFMDDWEISSLGSSIWQYGRDRDTVQPDLQASITSIQAT